jgi:hypothetical protein
VLFWFRTPPQIKVGREPFTDEVRRAIEKQNPGLKFDWVRLMATPIPAPDAEHWRERRRAEKAARQAMRETEETEPAEEEGLAGLPAQAEQEGQAGLAGLAGQAGKEDDESDDENEDNVLSDERLVQADTAIRASESQEAGPALAPVSGGEPVAGGRRRRRRGRRRRHQTVQPSSGSAAAASEPVVPNVPVPPTEEV